MAMVHDGDMLQTRDNKHNDQSNYRNQKIGMEARYNYCRVIQKSLMLSSRVSSDPALSGIAAKLQEAVEKGPYLRKKHVEAQPVVMTAERF